LADSDLDALRGEMEQRLAGATERLERLEARSGAVARVIAAAARSTIFLQGSYGFEDPASGRPLRLLLGPDGHPIRNPRGDPALTPEGNGPELELFYTGTGFVATDDGLPSSTWTDGSWPSTPPSFRSSEAPTSECRRAWLWP